MRTIRRDKLQRDIAAGKMEARLEYGYDGRVVHSSPDWKPATIAEYGQRDAAYAAGMVCFAPWQFQSRTGRAYYNLDGTISFAPADDQWSLRYKDTRTEAQRESDAVADRLHEMDVYTR